LKELKVRRYKGQIISDGRFQLDQLSVKPNQWYWGGGGRKQKHSRFVQHIIDTYGLSDIEYYCLVVYGDKDYRPTCPVCGKECNWNGKISKGFTSTCSIQCHNASDVMRENRFLKYNHKKAYLYICKTDDPNMYKLGVTGIGASCRTSYSFNGAKLFDHKELIEGTPYQIIKLETICRHKFCEGTSELFDKNKLQKVKRFIRNFNLNLII